MTKRGSNLYKIVYLDTVVLKDIPALPKRVKQLVKKAIETRLTVEPIGLGKPLRYSFVGHRRIRVGDYRIVFRVDPKKMVVTIVYIQHRKNVYKQ